MKITCKNCNKSFEGERYYGICPFCGTYHDMNTASGTAEDNPYTENIFAGGGAAYAQAPVSKQEAQSAAFSSQPQTYVQQVAQEQRGNEGAYARAMRAEDQAQQMKQMLANQRAARTRNDQTKGTENQKKSKAPVILVGINVVMIAMTVLYMNVAKYTATSNSVSLKDYTVSTYDADDIISVGETSMEITGIRTVDLSAYGKYIPNGLKMIEVSFEMTTDETSYYVDVNDIYIYDPVDDVYRAAVDSYDFNDFMEESTGVKKNEITNAISYVSSYSEKQGCFLFLLDKEATSGVITMERTAPEGKLSSGGYHSKSDELFYLYDRINIDIDITD